MRRIILVLSATAIVGLLTVGIAAESSASIAHGFSLTGSVVGGLKTGQPSEPADIVFTEKNVGTVSVVEDLDLISVTNASVVSLYCVLPNGLAIGADGFNCEPGTIKPGQKAAVVFNLNVTGSSGQTAAVKVCLMSESNGTSGPCLTVSLKIA
jgi:hypothetical protein